MSLNLFQPNNFNAQTRTIDSLRLTLTNAVNDTSRIRNYLILGNEISEISSDSGLAIYQIVLELIKKAQGNPSGTDYEKKLLSNYEAKTLNNMGYEYYEKGNVSNALEFYNKSLFIRERLGDKKEISNTLNNMGNVYKSQGNTRKALDLLEKSLKIREELKDVRSIGTSLNNIGQIYRNQGDISKALEFFGKCLKLLEDIGDKSGTAIPLNNMALIYGEQGDHAKALEFFLKSMYILEKSGNKKEVANSLNNIGGIYQALGNTSKTLEYYNRSLKIKQEIGDNKGIAITLNNIGGVYSDNGDNNKALEYYTQSLKIKEETGDIPGIAVSLLNVGAILFKQNNFIKAEEYCLKSLEIGKKVGYPKLISQCAEKLNMIYKASKNYKLALEYYELHIQMRDSLNNQNTRKASIKSQLKYEYEKQAAADSVAHAKESEIKNVELAKQKVEITAKKNQQYALFGGLCLVIVFAGFMYNRFKITQKQKEIIEEQKEIVEQQKLIVEEKQKEVLDSIHYAKRIQMALLPSETLINRSLEKLMKF